MRIVIGTNNRDKLVEIARILADEDVELSSLQDVGCSSEVVESGSTYRENAVLKATTFSQKTGLLCIAEDSGLEVDALDGAPGILSARWAGVAGDYAFNNSRLLELLEGVPTAERTARFVCVLAFAEGQRVFFTCTGTCEGRIALRPCGDGGFGYDPIFEIPEYGKTFAQLTEIKNRISHRARALAEFRAGFSEWKKLSICMER